MSFYNMMCGVNPAAGVLLAVIDLHPTTVPRLRDVYANDALTEVTVYTKTGGANRDHYAEDNSKLTSHPLYTRDYDDDFDSTFAHFVFSVPDKARTILLSDIDAASDGDVEVKQRIMKTITQTPKEKLEIVLNKLKEGDSK